MAALPSWPWCGALGLDTPSLPGKCICFPQAPLPPGSPPWASSLPFGCHGHLGSPRLCLGRTVLPSPVVSVVSPAHSAAQHRLAQLAMPSVPKLLLPLAPRPHSPPAPLPSAQRLLLLSSLAASSSSPCPRMMAYSRTGPPHSSRLHLLSPSVPACRHVKSPLHADGLHVPVSSLDLIPDSRPRPPLLLASPLVGVCAPPA